MKRSKILIYSMICLLTLVTFMPTVMAEDKTEEETSIPDGAFGFGFSSIGGSGISYKQFISPNEALQYSGAISGSSDSSIGYNFGVMYQESLHEGENTRLFFSPGISWRQNIDLTEDDNIIEQSYLDLENNETEYYLNKNDQKELSAGITWGMEYKFDRIAVGLFMGYKGSSQLEYDKSITYETKEDAQNAQMEQKFEFGPTGGLSLFYYF